ncbi:Kinesin-like protein KIN-7N [Diplonema papillatum]|nr:Kinesin-like protein KIN-7N [Diplonema papillatum]
MAFTLSHDSVRLAAGAPQTLTVTNGSSDAASFKIRLTHPANTTAKPAKGDLAPGESVPFEVALKGDAAEIAGADPPPRLLVQCTDAAGAVVWKQRLAIELAPSPGAAAPPRQPQQQLPPAVVPARALAEAPPRLNSTPAVMLSPASDSGGRPSFTITAKVQSVTGSAPFPGRAYTLQWKRGSAEGQCNPVAPAGSSVHVNQTITIPGCVTSFKAGKALKKYLVLTLVDEGGNAIGSLKILTSEFAAGEKQASLPITLNGGDAGTVGLSIDMSQQRGGGFPTVSNASMNSSNPSSAVSSPRGGGARRSFVEIPAGVPNGASADHSNPLDNELSPIRVIPQDQNIQVLVRVRPGGNSIWKVDQGTACISDDEKSHHFDYCFSPTNDNSKVWDVVGPRFIDAVTSGINGTIFMYGQTGSGKTHTMFGEANEPGLTPLLFQNLFERIDTLRTETTSFEVTAQYFEIYNEQLNDLLVSDIKRGRDLKMRQRADGSFNVPELVTESVSTMHDCKRLLEQGGSRKVMGYSNLNQSSSRSHTIFSITVISHGDASGKKTTRTATLNFCDLAGSESMNADGEVSQKKETVNINKSLTYLKNVIKQLAENEKHVSYRNSSLTRILKQSLGGNARTSIIITIHPGRDQQKDSRNSLHFGSMARTVKNRARVNAEYEDANLREQVKRLKAQLMECDAELEPLRMIRDDYQKLRDEYQGLVEQNDMLRQGATMEQIIDMRLGDKGGQTYGQGASPDASALHNREEALLKKMDEKDREIIDLKLAHSRELMNKTVQFQRAIAEQEQEETALELMQKDDRLDQLVYQILSYLHYGTEITRVDSRGECSRRLLYLITEDGHQHVCLCPMSESGQGQKDKVIERLPVSDIKKTVMGQYGTGFAKMQGSASELFKQSFSIVGKRGKRIDVLAKTSSDFEAWIQSLNHLTGARAEWGEPMDVSKMEDFSELDADERTLCAQMHIPPVAYLHARSQVLNKDGKFVTLFDVRTLACLDMYHCQKLFAFFMSKGWIGQRKLFFLDTEVISRTANLYEVEYDDDDDEDDGQEAPPASNSIRSHVSSRQAGSQPSYG